MSSGAEHTLRSRKRIRALQRLLRAAGVAVRNPKRLALTLMTFEQDYYRSRVARTHERPLGFPTVDLLTLCPSLRETVEPYAWLEGGSQVIDLALLKCLARRFEGCRYLEIGTWRGESVANVASVAEECFAVSLSDSEMRAAGWEEPFIETARVFSEGLPNVTHIGHDSGTFDFSTLPAMDLVFVDGDHSYEGVIQDTRNAFRSLRDESSIIVWHDYSRSAERDVQWDVVAGILDGCPVTCRDQLYHVSNTLCAVHVKTDLPGEYLPFPQKPDRAFSVTVGESSP